MFRRFDIGWKDPSGDHGLIAAHDGQLSAAEATTLYQWTDITRGLFRTHWLFVALTPQTMALIRVTPVEGGTRGTASYSHALLFATDTLAWGTDLAELLEVFPSIPRHIGQASAWRSDEPEAPVRRLTRHELKDTAGLLAAIFTRPLPLTRCELVAAESQDQETQVCIALRSYALLPRVVQAQGLSFATSEAPGFASPFFGFSRGAAGSRAGSELVTLWLSLQDELSPELLCTIDARSPAALLEHVAWALMSASAPVVPARADNLMRLLLAVPLGDLDDAKFTAVEQALLRLEGRAKGAFLIALLRRLEKQPVAGAHPLWIVRLLGDPTALAALPRDDRAFALRRFFTALPSELERVLPHLDSSFAPDLTLALRKALGGRGFTAGCRPAGFMPLACSVLTTSLLPEEVELDQDGQKALVEALVLVAELLEQPDAAEPLAAHAGLLADEVVATPLRFAAYLLALSVRLLRPKVSQNAVESLATSLSFLVYRSSTQIQNQRHAVQGLLDVFTLVDDSSSPRGAGRILDALQMVLPEHEQLWMPAMRECLSPTLNGRTHGSNR